MPSLQAWSTFLPFVLGIAGLGAAVVTYLANSAKDRELSRFQTEATERITKANQQITESQALIARLNVDLERQKQLTADAQNKLAWRAITGDGGQTLLRSLSDVPHVQFILASYWNDFEAASLASQLAELLRAAGLVPPRGDHMIGGFPEILTGAFVGSARPVGGRDAPQLHQGIEIWSVNHRAVARRLADALTAVGLSEVAVPDPAGAPFSREITSTFDLVILVGSKPWPRQ